MTGGILQLVARGVQDIYITQSPDITFFKSVYRRHTNLSRTEIDLPFNNNLNFGKIGVSRIEGYGDLLHKLYLRVKLPEINAIYNYLTVNEVQNLLKTYDITWDGNGKEPNELFDIDDYNDIVILIDEKVNELNSDIYIIDSILNTLDSDGYFFPSNWRESNNIEAGDNTDETVSKYYNDILINDTHGYFQYDKYDMTYKIIDSHMKDTREEFQLPVHDSVQIQNSLLREFINYATNKDNNNNSFNDENIEFIYNVDTAKYSDTGSINSADINTVFRSAINAIYPGISDPTSLEYYLDAYRVFDKLLSDNNTSIASNSDVNNVKVSLLNNIRFNLIKNIKQLNNIYKSLNYDSQFIFYRKLPFVSLNTYDTNINFVNNSTITNPVKGLQDNFTADFAVAPEPDEPSGIIFKFNQYVNTTITNFHNLNTNIYKDVKLNEYVNDITNLWDRINILDNEHTPTEFLNDSAIEIAPNMYFMNYLWFTMNDDIKDSIITYIERNDSLTDINLKTAFYDGLESINSTILYTIEPKITNTLNYIVSNLLHVNYKTNPGVTGDIIIFSIVRLGLQNVLVDFNGQTITIPDYILTLYVDYIENFNNTDPEYIQLKGTLLEIANLYMTDYNELPTYGEYVSRNFNIKQFLQINTSDPTQPYLFYDAQCSIWNHLFKEFVNNYDNMFNTLLLNIDIYPGDLGNEISLYLNDTLNILGYTDMTNPYDYFKNIDEYVTKLPENSDNSIGEYLAEKLVIFRGQLRFYDSNRLLLDMRNIILQKSRYLYDLYISIVNILSGRIETEPELFQHTFHSTPQDIVITTQSEYSEKFLPPDPEQFEVSRNNALDVVDILNLVVNEFILTLESTNPYIDKEVYFNDYQNKSDLWYLYSLKEINIIEELFKFYELFDWILLDINILNGYTKQNTSTQNISTQYRAENLYAFNVQINVLYNSFNLEKDIYHFMSDYVIQNSILKDLPSLLRSTVEGTYNEILNYYLNQKKEKEELLGRINGTEPPFISLNEILLNGLNGGNPANFAWIERLGHYLIEEYWINIDDQIIDKQYGEWLEIWHQLTKVVRKEDGYNTLIGHLKELYIFNKKRKNSRELLIPLQFWFNRHMGNSLPLIALYNANITVHFKLRKFEEVSCIDNFASVIKTPKLDCSLLGEFIFVDKEERRQLATSKVEYIIDTIQYNGELLIGKNNFRNSTTAEIMTQFKNPCKEMVWMMQDINLINGNQVLSKRDWNNYSYKNTNPIDKIKIKFNRRDREAFKDIQFYNLIHPYKCHYSTPSIGINTYSFALDPESVQPTGSANMSRIDDVFLEVKLKGNVLSEILNNHALFRFAVYALTINILRIFSGLAGLAFPQ